MPSETTKITIAYTEAALALSAIVATFVIFVAKYLIAERSDAQNTELRVDNALFPSALDHAEITDSELCFHVKDSAPRPRRQMAMSKEYADMIQDNTFRSSEFRKEHKVLCTCKECSDYGVIQDTITQLMVVAKDEYHISISCPEAIVQPLFVTSQNSNSFIGKINLILE